MAEQLKFDTTVCGFYFDSTILQKSCSKQALWCKKGEKKFLFNNGSRQRIILNAAVNLITGETLFHFTERLNSSEFINILISLLGQFPDQQLILILDNASWHKSQQVKRFLQGNPRLQLIFLPVSSPELNPVEKLWKWLKQCVSKNRYYAQMSDLISAASDFCALTSRHKQLVLQRVGLS